MDSCNISGEVTEVTDSGIVVRTIPQTVCSGCGMKSLCGTVNEKIISIEGANGFNVGDQVTVLASSATFLKIVFLLYFGGIIFAGGLSFILYRIFSLSDILSALIFIISIITYFLIIPKYLSKRYLSKVRYRVVLK